VAKETTADSEHPIKIQPFSITYLRRALFLIYEISVRRTLKLFVWFRQQRIHWSWSI